MSADDMYLISVAVEVGSVTEAKEIIEFVDGLREARFMRDESYIWIPPEYGTQVYDLTSR